LSWLHLLKSWSLRQSRGGSEGLFAKSDLDVEFVKFNSGAAYFAAFQSSSIDVGFFGIPPAATAVAQGIPIKIFAVESDSGDAEGLVARSDSGIKTLSDLRGKRIGTKRGSSAHTSLLMALSIQSLGETDIQLIDMDVTALIPAFAKGDIQAAWFWEPWMGLLKRQGGKLIATDRDIKKPDGIVWAVRNEWLLKNQDAMQRLLRVLDDAALIIRQRPGDVSKLIAKRLGLSEEHVLEVLTRETTWPTNAESAADNYEFSMSIQSVKAGTGLVAALTDNANFQKSRGIIDLVPDYKIAVDPMPVATFLGRK